MKKIITLLVALMAMVGFAFAETVDYSAAALPSDKKVTLSDDNGTIVTAQFIDDVGAWSYNKSNGGYIANASNGASIDFVPYFKGQLKIIFAASVATNKAISMNKMEGENKGEGLACVTSTGETVDCGAKPTTEIPSGGYVLYDNLEAGSVYKFSIGGTKYRVKGFSYTYELPVTGSISFTEGTTTFTWGDVDTSLLPQLVNEGGVGVTYASSNQSVATIDANGVVNVLAAGVTEISATSDEEEPSTASYNLIINKAVTAAPEVSFNGDNGEVTITEVAGADVYYTTNGTTPDAKSTKYEAPFTVADGTVVKAIAITDDVNYEKSDVVSTTVLYNTVEVVAPYINQLNGTFYVASETPATTIEISYDNETWVEFTRAITLNEAKTVYARANRVGCETSGVTSAEVEVLPVPEHTKCIIIGYGSFTTKSGDNTLYGTADTENRAYGMNLKMANAEKTYSKANNIYIDEANGTRSSIKGSNGTQNIIEIPEGIKITGIVLYSYRNMPEDGINDGWSEVNGVKYDVNEVPMGAVAADAATTPDRRVFNFDTPVEGQLTFNNGGRQLCFNMAVYIEETAEAPEASVKENENDVVVTFTVPEGLALYYNFETTEATPETESVPMREAAETVVRDGKTYTLLNSEDNSLTFEQKGTLSYFAQNPETGARSEVMTETISGGTSSLVEISAEACMVEYYNLQGIRVANPAEGVYIRKQGDNVSKVYVK